MQMMDLNAYENGGSERLKKMMALYAYANDDSKLLWKWWL